MSTTARLAWIFAVTAACAPAPQISNVPESRTASASSNAPASTAAVVATTAPASATAAMDGGAPDCSKDPWPVFKAPAVTAAQASVTGNAAKGPPARPSTKPTTHPNAEAGVVPGAAEVVAGMGADFRACFSRQLCDDPTAAGKLRLTAKIDPLGQVVDVTSELDGTIGPKGVACLESVMKSKLFSPPQGGLATLVVPLNLRPAE